MKPRGFSSFQEHDKFIENECSKLTKNDLLIYLGDYSLNTTDENTSSLLHKTKAKMFYIFGNHEGYHSRFYRESLHAFYKTFHNLSAIDDGLAKDHSSLHGSNFVSEIPFQIFPFSVDKTTKEGFLVFDVSLEKMMQEMKSYISVKKVIFKSEIVFSFADIWLRLFGTR